MSFRTTIALLCLAFAGLSVSAADNVKGTLTPYEEAVETTASALRLPNVAGGFIVTQRCASCPGIVLKLTNGTQFFVNRRQVPYSELLAVTRASQSPHGMTLFYEIKTKLVTRVVVFGPSAGTRN